MFLKKDFRPHNLNELLNVNDNNQLLDSNLDDFNYRLESLKGFTWNQLNSFLNGESKELETNVSFEVDQYGYLKWAIDQLLIFNENSGNKDASQILLDLAIQHKLNSHKEVTDYFTHIIEYISKHINNDFSFKYDYISDDTKNNLLDLNHEVTLNSLTEVFSNILIDQLENVANYEVSFIPGKTDEEKIEIINDGLIDLGLPTEEEAKRNILGSLDYSDLLNMCINCYYPDQLFEFEDDLYFIKKKPSNF